MAILGNDIWFEWQGGLHTALHESKIAEDELADMSNAIVRDGSVRLDQRYDLAAQVQEADQSPQGSGWGKYETGTMSNQYVSVLDNTLYVADLTLASLAWQAVIGGGALATGDWFWTQFENHLYGANTTDGIGRKLIAAGTDGTGNWSLIRKPRKPTKLPTAGLYIPDFAQMDFTGGSISNSGLSSATFANGRITCISTTAGDKSVTLTFTTPLQFNAQYRDILECILFQGSGPDSFHVSIFDGGNEYELIHWYEEPFSGQGARNIKFRLQNIGRSNRDVITAIKVSWTATGGTNTVYVYQPKLYGVWLSLPTSYSPGVGSPTFKNLTWVYSYFNGDTNLEGPFSFPVTIASSNQSKLGNWANVHVFGTAEGGVSKIRLYRVVDEGGFFAYYRLAELDNVDATYIDKLPLDEVEALTLQVPSDLPRSADCIATWQNRLWVGQGSLLQGSRSDDPLAFPDLTGEVDEFDPGRGLAVYPDDRRAERIFGIGSAQALYLVTDFSVRSIFGTGPDNWRVNKLFDEGAVGRRAWCVSGEGVIILTPSGRLMLISLLAPPLELSVKVRARIGNAGIKALATSDAVVAQRPDGQIEIRSGTAYMVLDWEGNFRKGTYRKGTHSLLFVSGLPLRYVGSDGKLYVTGDDSFTSDHGTEVEWFATPRKYLMPRQGFTNVYWGQTTNAPYAGGKPTYPYIEVTTPRGTKVYHKERDKANTKISVTNSGEWVQVKVVGNKDVVMPDLRLEFIPLSKAKHQRIKQ